MFFLFLSLPFQHIPSCVIIASSIAKSIKVTLGLVLIGAVPPIRGLLVFPAQILAGIAASGVVSALFPGPLLVDLSLGAGTSVVQGLFIEMFLTAQFLVVIFMLAVEKHRATFLAPVGIGLTLFICHMTCTFPSLSLH